MSQNSEEKLYTTDNMVTFYGKKNRRLPWALPFLKMSANTSPLVNSELQENSAARGNEHHQMGAFEWTADMTPLEGSNTGLASGGPTD